MDTVFIKDLLDCPLCGGKALPVIALPSNDNYIPDQSFWGDRDKMESCEYAGCPECDIETSAIKWQNRFVKKGV